MHTLYATSIPTSKRLEHGGKNSTCNHEPVCAIQAPISPTSRATTPSGSSQSAFSLHYFLSLLRTLTDVVALHVSPARAPRISSLTHKRFKYSIARAVYSALAWYVTSQRPPPPFAANPDMPPPNAIPSPRSPVSPYQPPIPHRNWRRASAHRRTPAPRPADPRPNAIARPTYSPIFGWRTIRAHAFTAVPHSVWLWHCPRSVHACQLLLAQLRPRAVWDAKRRSIQPTGYPLFKASPFKA